MQSKNKTAEKIFKSLLVLTGEMKLRIWSSPVSNELAVWQRKMLGSQKKIILESNRYSTESSPNPYKSSVLLNYQKTVLKF